MRPNKFIILIRFLVLSSALALGLTACGGGDDGGSSSTTGDVPNTSNLSAAALDIVTLDPRIGYPLKVSVSIDAVEVTNDVGLAFFIVDKDRLNVRQLALGTSVIPLVDAGNNTYEVEVDVPSSVEIAGPYFIGVIVDAANAIDETDEADNEASSVMTLSLDPVPNLFIENMEADRSAIELDERGLFEEQTQLGVVNSDAGGTLAWGVKGTKVPIDVEVFAVLRLTKNAPTGAVRHEQFRGAVTISPTPSGADTTDSYDVPLYLWDSVAERYMNAFGVDTTITDDPCPAFDLTCAGPTLPIEWLSVGQIGEMLIPGVNGTADVPVTEFDRRISHLDFYFPGKLAAELGTAARGNFVLLNEPTIPPPDLSAQDIQALRGFLPSGFPDQLSAAFCVKIRPSDDNIIEDSVDDNEVCSPVALLLAALPPLPPEPEPPTIPPQLSNPSNPAFFSYDYRNAWGGSFFGFALNFSASTSADNRGVIVNAQGTLPVQVFGQSVEFMRLDGRAQVLPLSDRDKPPLGQDPGFSLVLSHQQLVLASLSVPSGSVEDQLSFSKDFKNAEKIIAVGPVPVKLTAALTGNLGADYEIAFGAAAGNGLALTTAPFANTEVSVAASVTLLLADVGVEGVLTLFQEKFIVISSATINVLDSKHSDGLTSEIVIVPRLQAINELTGAAGALNVFVSFEIPTVRECSWGFFTGICPGTDTLKYPYNIASYTAWKKVDPLLDEQMIIDILTLPDGTVSYYQ